MLWNWGHCPFLASELHGISVVPCCLIKPGFSLLVLLFINSFIMISWPLLTGDTFHEHSIDIARFFIFLLLFWILDSGLWVWVFFRFLFSILCAVFIVLLLLDLSYFWSLTSVCLAQCSFNCTCSSIEFVTIYLEHLYYLHLHCYYSLHSTLHYGSLVIYIWLFHC